MFAETIPPAKKWQVEDFIKDAEIFQKKFGVKTKYIWLGKKIERKYNVEYYRREIWKQK